MDQIGCYLDTNKKKQMEYTANMMTSSNGNIFRVTGVLCGEFTGHRWIPLIKASDANFYVFFDLRLKNARVNTRAAGYLRRYRAHYDDIVMIQTLTRRLEQHLLKLGMGNDGTAGYIKMITTQIKQAWWFILNVWFFSTACAIFT